MHKVKLAVKFSEASFIVLLVGFCFSFVFAQEDEVVLDKIIVTAYKNGVSSRISPASSDVISVNEATAEGKFTVTDAIENISSINYATSGGIAGGTAVYIRGAGSQDTQVLLEGIKLYDPIVTSGYFYGYDYMSLDNLKSIEVLKGPYSSLYGSGSIGGTISLITEKGKGKPKLSYLQEFGSYDTYREKLYLKGSLDKLAYSFSLSKVDINSFYSTRYKAGNHERDPYHNFGSSFRLDYDFTDFLSATILSNYTYAKYEYDGSSYNPPYGPVDDNDNWGQFYQNVGGLIINHKLFDKFSQKFTFGYTRTDRNSWEDSSTDSWYMGKTYQLKWEGKYDFCNWDSLTFGFDHLKEIGESWYKGMYGISITPKTEAATSGYYFQNTLTPMKNLFIAASYRLEDHSAFHYHSTYSIAGSYIFESTNTKIKGSYGTGFKAPSLYQLYSTEDYGSGAIGNPDLNPEESNSYEIGVEQNLFSGLKFGITYFDTQLSNLIDFDSKYINAGEAKIFGLENFINYDFNSDNNIKLAYTYMDARNKDTKARLLRRADNKISCQGNILFFDKLKISPEISFVGNRIDGSNKLKAYVLANLSMNYKLNNNLEFFSRAENILNYDYQLVSGYETPKLSFYGGCKLSF